MSCSQICLIRFELANLYSMLHACTNKRESARVCQDQHNGLCAQQRHNYTLPRGYNIFSCLNQLSMKLLIETKILKNRLFLLFKLSDHVVFIMLINVKMPTIVGILTVMSMIKFMLRWIEQKIIYILVASMSIFPVRTEQILYSLRNV